jgi:hypothetical protein
VESSGLSSESSSAASPEAKWRQVAIHPSFLAVACFTSSWLCTFNDVLTRLVHYLPHHPQNYLPPDALQARSASILQFTAAIRMKHTMVEASSSFLHLCRLE